MNNLIFFFNFNSFLDHAFPGQFGFQYSASKIMAGIVNLHHFFMFFIVFVIFAFEAIKKEHNYRTINHNNNFLIIIRCIHMLYRKLY